MSEDKQIAHYKCNECGGTVPMKAHCGWCGNPYIDCCVQAPCCRTAVEEALKRVRDKIEVQLNEEVIDYDVSPGAWDRLMEIIDAELKKLGGSQ